MAAGTGSIQTRMDRRLKYRARYWHNGKQYSKSFERKTDAQLWLRNELSKLDNGSWLDPNAGRVTVREWSEEWLHGLTDQKPKTLHGYQSLLRSRVLPEFGDLELRQVTPAQVRKWMTAMSKEGLSNARSRQARQVLFSMYEVAVADGLVGRNPVAQVKAPSVRRRRQLFLNADQVSRLANACDEIQEGMGMLIRFAAYSGCRWGESVALRRSSVSKDGRRVRIKEAATEVGGRLEFGTPKTHEVRTVLLPKFVAARLAEHIEDLPKDALVFTTKTGGPLRGSNHRRSVWVPACEASKMPATLLFHDLRDTAASLMISAGASIKAIQRQLGHSSASMTLDVYGSLFEEDLEELADRLDEKFAASDMASTGSEDKVVHLAR
jgi:integrase